jgi:hypothetical protein
VWTWRLEVGIDRRRRREKVAARLGRHKMVGASRAAPAGVGAGEARQSASSVSGSNAHVLDTLHWNRCMRCVYPSVWCFMITGVFFFFQVDR